MRAIVIDDSPTMRSMIRAHLSKLGWSVVGEGENGVEALDLIRTLQPDLVTLDIIMPEMDGIECYRHLRQLEQPPRCLLLSVLAGEPRIVAAYESEILASHFLKKPFTEKDLKEKIELLMAASPLPYPIPLEVSDGSHAEKGAPPPPVTLLPLDN